MEETAEKGCFGVLDRVFPAGESGLREVPEGCLQCPDRVACLRSAVSTREGLRMREEMLDRAGKAGFVGRIERWSRKKELSRLMEIKAKEGK
ncbi:MAG: hypothetical protein AB1512_25120 [Thermodesulfobacteriota bacterium]